MIFKIYIILSILFLILIVIFRKKKISTMLIIGIFIITLVFLRVSIMRVSGISMYPTLNNGQFLLTEKMYDNIENGDIIVVDNPKEGYIVKRVVATSGDEVDVQGNKVYVNGELYEESSKNYTNNNYVLEDNQYYVLGDNESVSYDSRVFGIVQEDDVIAKVLFVE